jgi:hypothetical protein
MTRKHSSSGRGAATVAGRIELDQSCCRGTADHADGQSLQTACGVEPRGAVGRSEDHERGGRHREATEQHRPAAEAVGKASEQDQRRHEDEGVRRENRGEHEAREAELLRVHRVERRPQVRAGHQHEPGDPHRRHGPVHNLPAYLSRRERKPLKGSKGFVKTASTYRAVCYDFAP